MIDTPRELFAAIMLLLLMTCMGYFAGHDAGHDAGRRAEQRERLTERGCEQIAREPELWECEGGEQVEVHP